MLPKIAGSFPLHHCYVHKTVLLENKCTNKNTLKKEKKKTYCYTLNILEFDELEWNYPSFLQIFWCQTENKEKEQLNKCVKFLNISSAFFVTGCRWQTRVWEDAQSKCRVCLFVGCLTSQQHASVSQGPICSDNFMCCLTEVETADPTFYHTQSQYTDTGLTSPSADPIMPGFWQGSHWSANF